MWLYNDEGTGTNFYFSSYFWAKESNIDVEELIYFQEYSFFTGSEKNNVQT